MAKCKDCKILTIMEEDGVEYPWCILFDDCFDIEAERECSQFQRKTNADRIRNMTDEELANVIVDYQTICNFCINADSNCIVATADCRGGILQWLKSEVKE